MSIGKRVSDAFEKMLRGDAEGALFAICAAVEETARREGRPGGRRGYKAFVADNIHILTAFGLGHPVAGLLVHYSHPELPVGPGQGGQGSPIEDVIYHIIRCGLYHTASLPKNVHITQNRIGTDKNGALLLPRTLVAGIVMAVVCSPGNVGEQTRPEFLVRAFGEQFFLNRLWGKRAEVTARVLDLARRRGNAARDAQQAEPPDSSDPLE